MSDKPTGQDSEKKEAVTKPEARHADPPERNLAEELWKPMNLEKLPGVTVAHDSKKLGPITDIGLTWEPLKLDKLPGVRILNDSAKLGPIKDQWKVEPLAWTPERLQALQKVWQEQLKTAELKKPER